jgi:hypothetical protein
VELTDQPAHLLHAFGAAAETGSGLKTIGRVRPVNPATDDRSTCGCNQSFISNEIARRSDRAREYRRLNENRESNCGTSGES